MRCIVAYDISDDRSRDRVAAHLLHYGIRIQYSVFECELSGEQRKELESFLLRTIDVIDDSALILPTCLRCQGDTTEIGMVPTTLDEPYYIL